MQFVSPTQYSTDFQYFSLQSLKFNCNSLKKRISQIYRTLPYKYLMFDTFKDCLQDCLLRYIFLGFHVRHLKIIIVL